MVLASLNHSVTTASVGRNVRKSTLNHMTVATRHQDTVHYCAGSGKLLLGLRSEQSSNSVETHVGGQTMANCS